MNLEKLKQIKLKGEDKKIMKTKIKNEKGITLIALVVTIVVLLILAGVSINAVFSDNGIIKRTQEAQNKMDEARDNDLNAINDLNKWIDSQVNGTTGGESGGNGESASIVDGNKDGLHYHNDALYTGTCGAYTYEEGKIISKITFNFNGGIGIQNSSSQECISRDKTDSTYPTIAYINTSPTRDGYTLLGWSLSQTAITATYTSTNEIPRTLGEDVTYYAVWQ